MTAFKKPASPLSLRQLFPDPGTATLEGLYLSSDLRHRIEDDQTFVYSNFVTSLDGRIAITDPDTGKTAIPDATANPRDWRLLLELAAPADAVIVSGRYMRQLDSGDAQADPPLEGSVPEDVLAFRKRLALNAQPALVVISNSLNLPDGLATHLRARPVYVATRRGADTQAIERLVDQGIEVLQVGDEGVNGGELVEALKRRGLRLIYSIAGPHVMHTLLSAGVLNRLYLTTVLRVISGRDYATFAKGPELDPAYDFSLSAMYLDPHGPNGVQQMLQVFDARSPSRDHPAD